MDADPPAARVQVLGLCRFSLVSEGAFQVEHATIEERRAFLYDPVRLQQRFVWFEHVVLPCLRAQTDPDFTLVVLTGDDLPHPFCDLLEALCATVPQIVLDRRAPGMHRDLCRDSIRARIDPDADVVAQFRLDDDDAVAVDFVARLRSDFAVLRPIYAREGRLSLDYARGLVLAVEDGITLRPVVAANWTPALALFLPPNADRAILDYPHHWLLNQMSGVHLVDCFMFIRGRHETNDSRKWSSGMAEPLPWERMRGVLRERFGIAYRPFAREIRSLAAKAETQAEQ